MNLVASEYACQEERHGVLVLSEFTGAACFLKEGSILLNSSDARSFSDALYKALTMEHEKTQKNHEYLREFVTNHTRLTTSCADYDLQTDHV